MQTKPSGVVDRCKTFCGPICKTHFQLRADPQKMRQHIFFRDNGICAACGFQHPYLDGEWEADHVKPLMMAMGDPSFWDEDNVVILCIQPCHKIKSAQDLIRYKKAFRRRYARIFEDMSD